MYGAPVLILLSVSECLFLCRLLAEYALEVAFKKHESFCLVIGMKGGF